LSKTELERIKGISDMLVTAHSVLRDRYDRRAFLIDITTLGATLWLTAMAFVEPSIGIELTPRGFSKDLWLGLLAVAAFFLSIVQIRVDWKGKKDAHARACEAFTSVKRECATFLSQDEIDKPEFRRILDKYESAGTLSIPIPESEFNRLKSAHKLKVEVSRYLDQHPAASPLLLKLKLWWRDNMGKKHEKN
jgi:hypothetical protein